MSQAERSRRWRERHREKIAEYNRQWREKNRDWSHEYAKAWRAENRETMCAIARRYRARNRLAIKIARGLGIPIPEVRAVHGHLLEGAP